MTVKELIAALAKLDPKLPVTVIFYNLGDYGEYNEARPIDEISENGDEVVLRC